MSEWFVDQPREEIIPPRGEWSKLPITTLIDTKVKLSNRLRQYKNTANFQILQSAISELDSLIAQSGKKN